MIFHFWTGKATWLFSAREEKRDSIWEFLVKRHSVKEYLDGVSALSA